MAKPLEKEYAYYKEIRDELAKEHVGKLVAIKGQEVLGIFADYLEAAKSVYVEHERGTVLMQELGRDDEFIPFFWLDPEQDEKDEQMTKPLEKEYKYYLEIREELANEHDGKYVAIKGHEVLGIFADYPAAAKSIYVEHEYGKVLMQPIRSDPNADTIILHTPGILVLE